MFFCAHCCVPLGVPAGVSVPLVTGLPADLHIISTDKPSKSTAVHARVLAPTHVTVFQGMHDLPAYDVRTAVVLFPSEDSCTMFDLAAPEEVRTLVLVDSTWSTTFSVLNDPRVRPLRRVRLAHPPDSRFWRWHSRGDACLSTIEASACALDELRRALQARRASACPTGTADAELSEAARGALSAHVGGVGAGDAAPGGVEASPAAQAATSASAAGLPPVARHPSIEATDLLFFFPLIRSKIEAHYAENYAHSKRALPTDPESKHRYRERVRQTKRPRRPPPACETSEPAEADMSAPAGAAGAAGASLTATSHTSR